MKKIIVLSSLLLFVIYSCKNKKQISPTPDVLKNKNEFLNNIDSHFKEPDLTEGVDSTVEIYRIWCLSAFQDDTSNIIIIENKSDKITLTEKKFVYKFSIPISTDSVFHIRKKHLNKENWRLFKDEIYDSYFWNLTNSIDDDDIADCNTYIFEGAKNNNGDSKKYNVFVAKCPQGSLREVYNHLWNLSKTPR